jgi:deoxycytidylate deaminase
MEIAWKASENSQCYKKKVGAVFTTIDNGVESVLMTGYGDISDHRDRKFCEPHFSQHVCSRDDKDDLWFEAGCPSIHAEHRCLENLRNVAVDYSKVVVYVTHGPCDACLKMLDMVGVRKVFYDIPYKTNYKHWPSIDVRQIPNPSNREEGKSA